MAKIKLKGNEVNTLGSLPSIGSTATNFSMIRNDLSECWLEEFKGELVVLNIFPSIDTGTCALSVKQFNKMASELPGVKVLCISKDLPFAQKRFCGAEGIDKVETVSVFRSSFSQDYQLELTDGPLKGLCSRCILVLDGEGVVLHAEQVGDIVDEPNYEAVLEIIKKK